MDGKPAAIPGRFTLEISVMEEMGWSWSELMTTPAPVVEEIVKRLQVRAHYEAQKASLQRARGK